MRRLLLLLVLLAPCGALAHPGHGVALAHVHGELVLLALLVGALVAWRRP
jgi:hypothetical protein